MRIDMYLPAFPAIAQEFGDSILAVQYTRAAYNVGPALGQLLYVPLADQWGRKRGVTLVNLLAGLVLPGLVGARWGGSLGLVVPLFVVVSSVGFTLPNATVGSASALLLGTLMYSCGAGAACWLYRGLVDQPRAVPVEVG